MRFFKRKQKNQMQQEVIDHFERYKEFMQKAFYFDDRADMYYDLSETSKKYAMELMEDYYPFLKRHILREDPGKVALISLGCGNGWIEREVMNRMMEDGYDFVFCGIDSSYKMIEMAKKTLKGAPYPTHFICEDFANRSLKGQIENIVKDCDTVVYAFLGGTLGNIEQDFMADVLYDMLDDGDQLWIEVNVRRDNSEKNNRLLFERYLEYLRQQRARFFFKPLEDMGVDFEQGELFLRMEKEMPLNALLFIFGFKIFEKKVLSDGLGRTVTLLPNTVVDLMNIRCYDRDGLVTFFEERNFSFMADEEVESSGQFLFKKA